MRCRLRHDACAPSLAWLSHSREAPFLGRLHTLAVDERRRRTGFFAFWLPEHLDQMVTEGLPAPSGHESPQISVHSLPGREQRRWREMAPLATGPHEVEQPIENPPYVGGARPTTRLGRQDPRLDQAVLVITQGLAGSAIPDPCPILLRPQSPLRKENSPSERLPTPSRAADQRPRATFKTGSKSFR